MGGIVVKLKVWWETADKSQRMMAIFGSIFCAVLLFSVYTFASKPSMGLLASGLTGSEQGQVVSELQKMGVPYTMDMQGNVSVPTDKVAELRAKLMMSQKLPSGLRSGDEELSKLGLMNTPRVERERLKAILEGKLADTIQSLEGVDTARVMISLGDDSPFVNDRRPATASVTLGERGGSIITRDQARGIAGMVATSVPNLDIKNITILNRRGEALYDASDSGSDGKIGMKLEAERAESKRRERELQAKLDNAFGAGSTIATVNVELNFDKTSYTETTNTPTKLVTEEMKESMQGTGAPGAAGGPAGAVANTGAPASSSTPAPGANPDGKYENNQKKYDYAMNQKNTVFEASSGDIKSMAIGVLVSEEKKDNAKQVEEFIKGYLGPKAADTANYTSQVTITQFDTKAAVEAKKATEAAAAAASKQQIFSILPVAALVIVAFLVIKALTKMGKDITPAGGNLVLSTPGGQMLALPAGGIDVSERTARSLGIVDDMIEVEEEDPENPEGPKLKKKRKRRPEDDEDLEIDSIRRKVNIPLEQIKQMATDRPEMIAMLLKSWLADERR